jgi:death-on-curing protein
MRYLTVSDVLRLHQWATGVADPLYEFGLLESAVLRPQHSVAGHDAYPELQDKAAALMHSLIRNHPFIDGNKRTGVIAVGVFLMLNGWELVIEQGDLVGLATDIAEGSLDVPTISKHLVDGMRPMALPEEEDL